VQNESRPNKTQRLAGSSLTLFLIWAASLFSAAAEANYISRLTSIQ
jgi:hypothetical protein